MCHVVARVIPGTAGYAPVRALLPAAADDERQDLGFPVLKLYAVPSTR
jgi:hypothetical protein